MLETLWGIFCYSNNNCTFLTYIGGGWGKRDGGGDAVVDMLQVSQYFLCSIVTVFKSFTGSIHSNVVIPGSNSF